MAPRSDDVLVNVDVLAAILAALTGVPGGQVGTPVSVYDEENAVVKNVLTNVLSYTVPIGKTLYLARAVFSGDNVATYELYFNSVLKDRKRTYFGGDLDGAFEFSLSLTDGHPIAAGTIIDIEVEHARPDVGDFNARIQGLLVG